LIKVLHVLDVAGVPSIISHYYNKLNKGRSDLIYHEKKNFSRTITRCYEGIPFNNFRNLLLTGFFKSFQYNIIHIHGAETLIPFFKLTGKKVVLHYHGSDIRHPDRSEDKKRIRCRSRAELILFNSKNMKQKIITSKEVRKEYLPNLVDTDHFCLKDVNRSGRLSITSSNHDKEKTIEDIKKEVGKTTIIDLDFQQIPYSLMPKVLSKYEMYVDIRIMPWGQKLEELSTTALQALACGCKVYHNGKIIEKLPSEHKPYNFIKKLNSFYNELLK